MSANATPIPLSSRSSGRSVYYGWVNLAAAAVAMVATLPGRTQGLGLITEPLMRDLGVDRVAYANINLWATLIGASFCLPVGRLLDRYGTRIVMVCLLAALGATTMAMSSISTLMALWITVTLTRGFGQSALSVASLALVGKWFARRLNVAMGVYSLLVGVGFIAAFPVTGHMVLARGWRAAWFAGSIVLLVLAPLAWTVVRNGSDEDHDPVEAAVVSSEDMTLADALRTAAFWLFAISSAVFGLVYSGIALFNQSILEERGFDAGTYHAALVISTLTGLLANFAGGWLATRWPIQRVMGIAMAVLAGSLLLLPAVRTFTHVAGYAAMMGIAGGVVTVVFFSVWAQVFGRLHLGRIQGVAQMLTVLASAVGPLLLAQTLRTTGSYSSIFFLLAGVVAALGIACWQVKLPRRNPPSEIFQG
ncbi:MAG TPA: MFS transporter [Bryobacteraceae bacterium]|nr:MFS transporter [Bryobacteraceae bacterium]